MQFGRKLIHLDSVDSTNNYVANLVKEQGLSSGTVIMADHQFAGKGQRDAEWQSLAGMNITLSIYLDDVNLSVNRQFRITQLISLGIHEFLKQQSIESEIKWPNDVYVNGVKIGGILIESHISGKEIKSSIIGIGLNVNQKDFGSINATSMSLESGKQYILNELYFSFIHVMNGVWEKYWADINLDKRYLNSLYRIDVRSSYTDKNGEFEGVITGVSSEGKLRMERGAETIEYSLKEISFR